MSDYALSPRFTAPRYAATETAAARSASTSDAPTPSNVVTPMPRTQNTMPIMITANTGTPRFTGSYTLVTPKGKLHFAELRSLILVTV